MEQRLQQELINIVKGRVLIDEPMKDHTTIKIGGPADAFVEPVDMDDLQNVFMWADKNNVPKMILGNGSNTLVRDSGIRGIVISLAKFDYIKQNQENRLEVTVGAGFGLPRLVLWSAENSLAGLEGLAGIPGTVGGGIIMNAGTKDHLISDHLVNIKWINRGRIVTVKRENLEFHYRKLKIQKGVVVIEATFLLKEGNKLDLENKIEKIRHKRKEVQPLIWPSLGSVFKNPEGGRKAWELIDECNLRGVRVGGARISNEHANWIINEGGARAKDVEVLIKMVREQVKESLNILLEPEIIIVGE
jgi:UDP-N-acetylmuramate dehydrogenase